jgi:hypothetical protein
MTLTAANPVLEAINGLLQDATLQAALGGRIGDSLPEDVARPCTLFSLASETDTRGLGTGNLPECELRVYTYSEIGSLVEAQEINRQIVTLLKDASITVTGFTQAGTIVYRETSTFPDSELNGVKVHEVVSSYTLWVES